MGKKKPTCFKDIRLVGVHKEPDFGPGPLQDLVKIDGVEVSEVINQLQGELDALKEFARHVIEIECWSLFPQDGYDLQKLAEKLGLIVKHTATEKDVDDERYEEMGYEVGDDMFVFSKTLKGD